MKVKRLIIKNIGMIKDTTIELNKPLILFYGELMQGKTTILNSVKWCFGGPYPSDIIRHGEKEASVTLEFEGGSILREWYKGKDEQTHAREIVFVNDGKIIKKPVKEIEKFLNPFLLDQDYLRKMTELERKQYFTQLFAVDTTEIDNEMSQIEIDARDLRSKIKGYGEIDLTEVKPIDISPLKVELTRIKGNYASRIREIDTENRIIIEHNRTVQDDNRDIQSWDNQVKEIETNIKSLQTKLEDVQNRRNDLAVWVKENPPKPEQQKPEPPDTSSLENEITEATANQVRVEQYQKNLTRSQERG
jgi:DNA repair ATPase RecN